MSNQVKSMYKSFLEAFIQQYSVEYGEQKGSLVTFNHDKFVSNAVSVKDYRRRIRVEPIGSEPPVQRANGSDSCSVA